MIKIYYEYKKILNLGLEVSIISQTVTYPLHVTVMVTQSHVT